MGLGKESREYYLTLSWAEIVTPDPGIVGGGFRMISHSHFGREAGARLSSLW